MFHVKQLSTLDLVEDWGQDRRRAVRTSRIGLMRLRRRDKEPAVVPGPQQSESLEPNSRPTLDDGDAGGPTSTVPVRSVGLEPTTFDETSSEPVDGDPVEAVAHDEAAATSEASDPIPTAPVAESGALPESPETENASENGPGPDLTSDPEPDKSEQSKPPTVRTSAGPSRDRATRAPSIPEEADELLNGKRPLARPLPRVIAIANQKGGVGKTTTTVNLGAALAEQDYRVLVVDLDPQGNATTGLGVEARNFEFSMYDVIIRDHPLEDTIEPTSVKNLFVAPATIDLAGIEIELVPAFSRELKLKRAIDSVVDDFDFVLIDCPPSLGLITVNGLAAAHEVLVPIQCEYYALEGLSQLLRNVNLVSTNLNEALEVTTIVLTMFDARTRLSVDVANEVRAHFSERVCKVVIPRTVRLSEAPSFGQPITVFDPASRGAVAYRELAKEVSNGAPQRTR
jgi:chromosome partitioning protein